MWNCTIIVKFHNISIVCYYLWLMNDWNLLLKYSMLITWTQQSSVPHRQWLYNSKNVQMLYKWKFFFFTKTHESSKLIQIYSFVKNNQLCNINFILDRANEYGWTLCYLRYFNCGRRVFQLLIEKCFSNDDTKLQLRVIDPNIKINFAKIIKLIFWNAFLFIEHHFGISVVQ